MNIHDIIGVKKENIISQLHIYDHTEENRMIEETEIYLREIIKVRNEKQEKWEELNKEIERLIKLENDINELSDEPDDHKEGE